MNLIQRIDPDALYTAASILGLLGILGVGFSWVVATLWAVRS